MTSQIAMGKPVSVEDAGSGWFDNDQLNQTITQLLVLYPDMRGVFGWQYSSDIDDQWQEFIYSILISESNYTLTPTLYPPTITPVTFVPIYAPTDPLIFNQTIHPVSLISSANNIACEKWICIFIKTIFITFTYFVIHIK